MLGREGEETGKLRPRTAFAKPGYHTAPFLRHGQTPWDICKTPAHPWLGCREAQGTWRQAAARAPMGASAARARPG